MISSALMRTLPVTLMLRIVSTPPNRNATKRMASASGTIAFHTRRVRWWRFCVSSE